MIPMPEEFAELMRKAEAGQIGPMLVERVEGKQCFLTIVEPKDLRPMDRRVKIA